MLAPAAFAQSGSDGYNAVKPEVIQEGSGTKADSPQPSSNNPQTTQSSPEQPTPATATKAGNELPFTGLDVGLVAAAGAALLGAGAGMRRLTRAPDAV